MGVECRYERVGATIQSAGQPTSAAHIAVSKKAAPGFGGRDSYGDTPYAYKATSKHLGILSGVDALEKEQKGLVVLYRLSKTQRPVLKHFLALV